MHKSINWLLNLSWQIKLSSILKDLAEYMKEAKNERPVQTILINQRRLKLHIIAVKNDYVG
jgi:hypothetical protein